MAEFKIRSFHVKTGEIARMTIIFIKELFYLFLLDLVLMNSQQVLTKEVDFLIANRQSSDVFLHKFYWK